MENEFGVQIAGGEFNHATRVFEKILPDEPCGCRRIEWTIHSGWFTTVVRQRFAALADCPHGHRCRSKIMRST